MNSWVGLLLLFALRAAAQSLSFGAIPGITAGSAFSLIVNKAPASADSVYLALMASNGAVLQGTLLQTNGGATAFTFAGLKVSKAGTYTFLAVCSGYTSAVSVSATVANAGAAVSLKFSSPPPASGTTSTICPVTVSAYDSTGLNVFTGFTGSVQLTLMVEATAGTMSSVSVSAVAGVATFSSCAISGSGNFRLRASSGALTDAVSNTFAVTASSTIASIKFDQSTYTGTVGSSVAISVSGYDSSPALITSFTSVLGLSVTSGAGAATGTISANAVSGTAALSPSFTQSGSYSITAVCGSCSGVTFGTATVTISASTSAAVKVSFPNPLQQGFPGQYYQIYLASAPTASVTVQISSVDTSLVAVQTTSLTFTTGNYATSQNVNIGLLDGPCVSGFFTAQIMHTAVSSDSKYNGTGVISGCGVTSGVASFKVACKNDYIVSIDPSVSIQEGESASYSIVLQKAPTNNVIISLSYPSSSYYSVSPITLTFTSVNWNSPQSITITSYINPTASATGTIVAITHSVSGDLNYSNTAVVQIIPSSAKTHVHIAPMTTNTMIVSSQVLIQDRGSEWYTLRLGSAPTGSTTITLTSSDATVTFSPATLTFSDTNFAVPQTVTIHADTTGKLASIYSYDETITHTAAGGGAAYTGRVVTNIVTVLNVCTPYSYYWPSGTECRKCMVGYDCTGTFPVACPSGYYNNVSTNVACIICPAGSECPDPKIAPTACLSGYYSRPGAIKCTICPTGKYCPAAVKDGTGIQVCDEGYYASGGQASCTQCTAGNYCPSIREALVFTCPSGWTSDAGKAVCIPCPEGFECATSTSAPTACAAGKFSIRGQSACTTCPAHMECLSDSGPTMICPEGSYAALGSTTACTTCTAGNYCSAQNLGVSTACAAGTYSRDGASICLPCPPGASCATPGSAPVNCLAGFFSPGGIGVTACSPCPSGFYSTVAGSSSCIECPAGYKCATASVVPVLCDINTYSYAGAITCAFCWAGYACPKGSVRPDPPGFECPPGSYCDGLGTLTSVNKCPAKFYNPYIRGSSLSDCYACPKGKDCSTIVGTAIPPDCLAGQYCLGGGNAPKSCFAGTYNPNTGGRQEGDCLICPEGFSCGVGISKPTLCSAGHICPLGSGSVKACPAGTYNPFSNKYYIEDCLPCPAGAYCPSPSSQPVYCPQGFYNPHIGASTLQNCMKCEPGKVCNARGLPRPLQNCLRGYFCPLGSIHADANPCPPGTFTDEVNLRSKEECTPCPIGKVCYQGTTSSTFASCAAGYYCPLGTGDPYANPCPAGTYTASTQATTLSDCLPCPPGQACARGTSVPIACTAGYYCPRGTSEPDQYPCPAGTFSLATNLVRAEQCTLCTTGNYCPEASTVVVACPTNTYNDATGASSKGPAPTNACKQCPGGATCSGTGLTAYTACGSGMYSQVGATACSNCWAGYYCDQSTTSFSQMVLKPCPAGYLCPLNTAVNPYSNPSLLCSAGKYCPEAASVAISCPVGTYRNIAGGASVNDCKPVPAGFFSNTVGTIDYTPNKCQAGYYCLSGSTSATQNACPPGTFRSIVGAASATDCVPCTAGLYCSSPATVTGTDCPVGKYCPTGSVNPTMCPRGTYSNTIKLESSEQCTPCDAGKYCAAAGQTAITDPCKAGYYCKGGAYTDTPVDGTTGSLCPAGGYCPAGTSAPQPCPNGQYNNFSGAIDASGCSPCRPGYYCSGTLTATPSGPCQAGYYCSGGSSSPTQNQAQAGYYAPTGSISQIPCAPGTYNPSTLASACLPCPIGNYCPTKQMTAATPCPIGFYCPIGTVTPLPCPSGTFRSTQGAKVVGECTTCTAGNYCNPPGASAVTNPCKAGFFCTSGAKVDAPVVLSAGNYGPCPVGYYCIAGTSTPTACPVGTYNPSQQAQSLADCLDCWPGYACTTLAKTSVDLVDKCNAGYYCGSASTSLSPPANLCQLGYMCPVGSPAPVKCAPGTYQDQFGQSSCIQCPAGYYCSAGTGAYTTYGCPKGYYCPAGTQYSTQYPCPPGKYNDQLLGQDNSVCKTCTAGSYCSSEGAPSQTGSCDPGFYCTAGALVARPISAAEKGGRCGPGYYCPLGSIAQVECMGGFYCAGDQLAAPSGNCKAGYYCATKATVPTPTDGITGDICSKGSYCLSGSSSPTSCNTGTYLPYKGATASTECMPCTPGFYCDALALIVPVKQCPLGFYCPSGSIAPVLQCDKGYYCPLGSASQIKCLAGQYQDQNGQSSCKACPAGYYCLQGTQTPVKCPKGFYCPAGTLYTYQNPCPVGTYNPYLGKSALVDCLDCDASMYCESVGLDAPTGTCAGGYYCPLKSVISTATKCPVGNYCPVGSAAPTPCPGGVYCNQEGQAGVTGSCLPGYYCVGQAISPNPTDNTTGNLCQAGKYCPAAAASQYACPAGSYSTARGLNASTQCLACPYGYYCAVSGLTTPTAMCDAGFYCSPGSASSQPSDSICPAGYQCPAGAYEPQPCPMGTYTTLTAKAACDSCTAGQYCLGGTSQPTDCPKGYSCPAGTRFSTEFQCADGSYTDSIGQATCTQCPAGKQCNNAATTSTSPCATYLYCPAGTGYGLICPAGSYNPSSTNLSATSQCQSCPSGFFCVDGRISGQCEPGYYCLAGNSSPTPNGANGYPCPAGFYCERATSAPTQCPKGKFRSQPGARQITDCTDCPPGYYCPPSASTATVPVLCPRGNYCPQSSQAPLPCPIRRYNPNTGSSTSEDCIACPSGYLCTDTGIGDPAQSKYLCRPAYFCVEGAPYEVPCPPGTFRALGGARSVEDCTPCTGGNQCPGKTAVSYGCPEGTYCPVGSPAPRLCTPGFYCPVNTTSPELCPSGSYCPKVTQDQVDLVLALTNNNCTAVQANLTVILPPHECPQGTVCPMGSFDPQLCKPGWFVSNNTCKPCSAGTYSKATGSLCQKCRAGYLCVYAATRPNPTSLALHGGTLCPAGGFCEEGATKKDLCEIGTYNPNPGGTNSTSCLISPANYYADQVGMAAVPPCGSSAWSDPGSQTCKCTGAFRSFLKTDSSCRCLPGYEYTEEGITLSEKDSTTDCWPKVVEVCSGIRAPNGKCNPDCSLECASGAGERQANSGLCVCSDVQTLDQVCDADCRTQAANLTLRSDGFYNHLTANGVSTLLKIQDLPGYYGSTSGAGQVFSVNMTTTGPSATYGTGATVRKIIKPVVPVTTNTTGSGRRLASPEDSVITDPVACLHVNDTFLFSISDKQHYPIYLKDSLLNTNLHFDYVPFLELQRLVKSELSYISTFAFTFTQEGLYDFADAESEDRHILVAVVSMTQGCPESAALLTRTADTMTQLGFQVGDTIQTTNWLNIGLVMIGLVLMVVVITGGLYTYKWWKWTPVAVRRAFLGKVKRIAVCGCCRRRRADQASEEDEAAEGENLEATMFQTMYDKLKNHESQLKKGFSLQSEETSKHLQDVLGQAERLRDLLEAKLSALDPSLLRTVEDRPEEEEESIIAPSTIQKFTSQLFSGLLKQHIPGSDMGAFKHQVSGDVDLSEEDKKELLNDLNANLQRIENATEAERKRAQEALEQRLRDKKARRRQAKNKVLDLEWQRQEMLKRQEAEKNLLKQQFQDEVSQLEKETGSEKLKIKREERQDLEKRLDELRSQLQSDLARSQGKEETEDLLKSYELEAKRVEQQLMAASQKHEQDLLRRLEERRKARQKAKQADLDAKLKEIEDRHSQELSDLTTAKARIGLIDESAEVPPLNQEAIAAVEEKHTEEKEDLEVKHQQEQAALQVELERGDLSAKKARLQQELAAAGSQDEKEALLEELEAAAVALKQEEAAQGERFREQLRQRKAQRAAKLLALKQKQREEADSMELDQELENERAQHQAEMRRINDLLAAQEGASPDQLAALLRRLLDEKHEKELSDLTNSKQKRLKNRQAHLLSDQLEIKANRMADIRSRFADLRAELERRKGKMTQAEYENELNRLAKEEHDALQQMDFDFMADMNYGQSSNLEQVEEEFRQRYLGMVQRQMQEINDVLNRIKLLDWNLLQAHMADAKQDVVERQALIDKLYSEKMDDLEMTKRRMAELQREKVRENDELEGNIREVEDKQRKLAETELQRQKKLQEQEERLNKLRAAGLSDKELGELVSRYQAEMQEWEKAVDSEREKQQSALQKRLEVKKQQHQKRLQEKLEAYKSENLKLLQKEPEKPRLQYRLERPLRLHEPLADVESGLRLAGKDGSRGEDLVDLLLRKVRRVEDLVAEADTKHFEQAMKSLNQLNDLIGKVRARK